MVLATHHVPFPNQSKRNKTRSIQGTTVRTEIYPSVVITMQVIFTFFNFSGPNILVQDVISRRVRRRFSITLFNFHSGVLRLFRHTRLIRGNFMIKGVVPIIIIQQLMSEQGPGHSSARFFRVIRFFNRANSVTGAITITIPRTPQVSLVRSGLLPPVFFRTTASSLVCSG